MPKPLPVIDIGPLVAGKPGAKGVGEAIGRACRDTGFFYVLNHGVPQDLQDNLERASREFFALTHDEKMRLEMKKGGKAWRGYFPVGGEMTSGYPDNKEGLYLGVELPPTHPDVVAGLPLHGSNLFPERPKELRELVPAYMAAMTALAHRLMAGIAMGLGLEETYFDRYTRDPFLLFRIFHYPAELPKEKAGWGVGEHTDYGLLTILKQDDCGGLEVRSEKRWIAAPPIQGSFVVNIGDMLDRMTGGLFRSTPHRVQNTSGRDRLSFPFFFDPNFHVEVRRIETPETSKLHDDKDERWDKTSVHAFEGKYGDYLMSKVSKVFPELGKKFLA